MLTLDPKPKIHSKSNQIMSWNAINSICRVVIRLTQLGTRSFHETRSRCNPLHPQININAIIRTTTTQVVNPRIWTKIVVPKTIDASTLITKMRHLLLKTPPAKHKPPRLTNNKLKYKSPFNNQSVCSRFQVRVRLTWMRVELGVGQGCEQQKLYQICSRLFRSRSDSN